MILAPKEVVIEPMRKPSMPLPSLLNVSSRQLTSQSVGLHPCLWYSGHPCRRWHLGNSWEWMTPINPWHGTLQRAHLPVVRGPPSAGDGREVRQIGDGSRYFYQQLPPNNDLSCFCMETAVFPGLRRTPPADKKCLTEKCSCWHTIDETLIWAWWLFPQEPK